MKFRRPRTLSKNIEDRRGAGPQRGRRGGMTTAGLGGAGGLAAIVALMVAFCGGGGGLPGSGFDVSAGGGLGAGVPATDLEAPLDPANDPNRDDAELASVVLDSVQEYWAEVFAENNLQYQDATLVLFTEATPTDCGQGSAQTGPFYCSLDQKAYIDLTFWDLLASPQFGASGDFAQAYVIAHEIGHHVQNLLGISDEVRALSQQNPGDTNALSVRQELQADCFAGAWAGVVFNEGTEITLDDQDIREALDAAAAVGDDRIQEKTTGQIEPHKWTHGSADQRQDWFLRGFETGDPSSCDSFS